MGLWLLPKKHLLLFAGMIAAFIVPMINSGELTVSKIAGWATGASSESTENFESLMANRSSQFGGYAPNGQSFPVANSQSGSSSSDMSLAKIFGSIFQTQSIDANGNVIAIPETTTNALPNSGGIPSQLSSFSTPGTLSQQALNSGFGDSTSTTNKVRSPAAGNQANRLAGPVDPISGLPVTPIDFIPVFDLREIIRFDVSPQWVQQRWVRTSAAIQTVEGYQGLRVALVAGTGTADMTGALTYYFDNKDIVQRIQFQGTSANPQAIERLLTEYFQFKPVSDRSSLYAPVVNDKACGMLRFQLPVILNREQPITLAQVAFEINSTKGAYQLSDQFRQLALQ